MTIGIIGYGQFGKFIHTLCTQYLPDAQVLISSRSFEGAKPLEEVCQCDVVFPCMPISVFAESMQRIVPLLGSQTLVREVCTVKCHPCQILQSIPGLRYICSHPMFGSESYKKKAYSLQDLRLVVCDSTLTEAEMKQWRGCLDSTGLVVIEMTPEQHDRQLAETLFLTHYVSQIVYQAGFDRTTIDTVSFGFLMDAVESVKDNADLFYDVWKFNPYCKEVVGRCMRVEHELLEKLGGERRKKGVRVGES